MKSILENTKTEYGTSSTDRKDKNFQFLQLKALCNFKKTYDSKFQDPSFLYQSLYNYQTSEIKLIHK